MLTGVNKNCKKEKYMITKSLEEYLKTMYVLKKQNGNIRVTDIAKEASDIILLERNLNVIYDGVIEGRKVYGNIIK